MHDRPTSRHALLATLSALALAVPVIVTAAAPASGASGGNVVFRDHRTLKDSHIEQEQHGTDFCPEVPFDIRFDGIITLTDTVTLRGRDGLEHYSFQITAKNTYVNVETGASFREQTTFMSRDQRVDVDDEGNLVIRFMDRVGYKLFDGDGRLVGNDSGLVKVDLVLDIRDPNDPEDDTVVSEVIAAEHGVRSIGQRDFCQDVMAFIG